MKISEMNNEQAAEALIRLAVPFGNICDDEKTVQMIEKYTKSQGEPVIKTIGKILPEVAAHALKEHKVDLFEIVGALTGKTQAQVAKMNFLETIKIVRDSYDEVLKSFFTSSAQQIKQTVQES